MQCSSIAGLVLFSILAPVRVHAQTTADTSRAGAASSTPAVPATPSTTVKVGGYVQLRETAQERVGLTGTLNRARISADVGLPNGFSAPVASSSRGRSSCDATRSSSWVCLPTRS